LPFIPQKRARNHTDDTFSVNGYVVENPYFKAFLLHFRWRKGDVMVFSM